MGGNLDKKLEKLYRKPIPNDIMFDEIVAISEHFGCFIDYGGNHVKIVYKGSFSRVIPIPRHGKTVQEVYIKQVKELIDRIREEKSK